VVLVVVVLVVGCTSSKGEKLLPKDEVSCYQVPDQLAIVRSKIQSDQAKTKKDNPARQPAQQELPTLQQRERELLEQAGPEHCNVNSQITPLPTPTTHKTP
jgi:hypothetical protein